MIHKASQRPHKEPTYRPYRGLTQDPFKHQQAPQRPYTGLIHVSHKPYAGPTQVPHHIGLRQASHRPHQTSCRHYTGPNQAPHRPHTASYKSHKGLIQVPQRHYRDVSHRYLTQVPKDPPQVPNRLHIGFTRPQTGPTHFQHRPQIVPTQSSHRPHPELTQASHITAQAPLRPPTGPTLASHRIYICLHRH